MVSPRLYGALVTAFTLAVWLAMPAGAVAGEDQPAQAVAALHTVLNANDVDSSSDLFADDAVVIQPRIGGLPQIYLGQEQIKWWLRNLVAQHAQWTVAQPARLVGAHTIEWTDGFSLDAFRQLGLESVEVKSDAVLADDGRITALTIVLTPAAARSVQLAPGGGVTRIEGSDPTPALTVVGAVLLVGVGFSIGAWTMAMLTRRRQPNHPATEPVLASRT